MSNAVRTASYVSAPAAPCAGMSPVRGAASPAAPSVLLFGDDCATDTLASSAAVARDVANPERAAGEREVGAPGPRWVRGADPIGHLIPIGSCLHHRSTSPGKSHHATPCGGGDAPSHAVGRRGSPGPGTTSEPTKSPFA